MTYFGFLAIYLCIPLAVMILLTLHDRQSGRTLPAALIERLGVRILLLHVAIAVVYTTPWDNYLVATGVWYYNPELVVGLTLGWVPIEEYTFFVLQTLVSGLWLLYLGRRMAPASRPVGPWKPAWMALGLVGALWVFSAAILAVGWAPGTYLALILVWALPPVAIQLAFGSDILARHWRLAAVSLLSITAYLGLADSLAIDSGTWTIDPAQSLNIFVGGVLPVEELLFFFMTNVLIVFGMLLMISADSQRRAAQLLAWIRLRRTGPAAAQSNPASAERGADLLERRLE